MLDALPAAHGEAALTAVVVGVGSPFGDDRVGWEVVAALDAVLRERPLPVRVRTYAFDRPGAALAGVLECVQQAVIVDATRVSGLPPGTLRWVDERELEATQSTSTHGVGVGEALALARALGNAPQRVDVLAISAERFEGEALSGAVRDALPAAVAAVVQRLLEHSRSARS